MLGYGSIVQQCLEAARLLRNFNINVTVADARFCKPLDTYLIRQLAAEHEFLITVEEGSIGGFGSHVAHFLSLTGLLDGHLKVPFSALSWIFHTKFSLFPLAYNSCILQLRPMTLPDRYIDHGSHEDQMEEAGLSSRHLSATVLSLLGRPKEALG